MYSTKVPQKIVKRAKTKEKERQLSQNPSASQSVISCRTVKSVKSALTKKPLTTRPNSGSSKLSIKSSVQSQLSSSKIDKNKINQVNKETEIDNKLTIDKNFQIKSISPDLSSIIEAFQMMAQEKFNEIIAPFLDNLLKNQVRILNNLF